MAQKTQNYQNHTRWLPPFHFFVLPVLLLYVVNSIRHLWYDPTRSTGLALVVAIALFMLAVLVRGMAVTAQDRIIRLEMRLRLRDVLPADMRGKINDLTKNQLVALRFASDAELPDVVRDVLAGKLASQKEIKLRVKDWQADWLRV